MHPRNLHNDRYDFDALTAAYPDLQKYVRANPVGDLTIDFSDASAVYALNHALLTHHYGVARWPLPKGALCPGVPGRADYIHYLADLLGHSTQDAAKLRIFDLGTGANCIYPILGSQLYGWKFVGSEIDAQAFKAARATVEANACLRSRIRVVRQKDPQALFAGAIKRSDRFAATMCNPPFHESAQAAQVGSQRKRLNVSGGKDAKGAAELNFGGLATELWCAGGEFVFIKKMIQESVDYREQVGWFTTLVSKSAHVEPLHALLESSQAAEVRVIPMQQGQKVSRFLAWRFE
jgi:23S rRNA (adenine1618-N6)-methyltransferase